MNVSFIFGFIFGSIVGGLVATFIVPMFWKPKA